jgi:hypothetical protein
MIPWRVYFLFLQDHAQWIGTYGEMISLNLHGDKIPPDGCCDPNQGKETLEDGTRKEEECFLRDTLKGIEPMGYFPSTMTLALEGPRCHHIDP